MGNDEDQLLLVRALIDRLRSDLTADDVDNGWNEDSRRNYLAYFIGLEKKIVDGERIEAGSISRSMDHWGIGGGQTLEMAARLSVLLSS